MNKKILSYMLIFIIFLGFNLLISPMNLDEVWSYGFTKNISSGLIPYVDFNMVITPFYPMIMGFFIHFFNDSFLVFHIINSLMILIFIFFVFKLLNKKAYIVLPLLIFPLNITFPNYNFLLLLLFVFILYLEKIKANDYLIGLILALIFLTKQSVGLVLFFSIFFYFSSKDKLFKRIVAFIIPNIIFMIYLIISNSYKEFFDLCFLGLFDFGKGNGTPFNIFFFFVIMIILFTIYLIIKNRRNIYYYYLLLFSSICFPIFDLYHFNIYLVAFLIIVFINFDFKVVKYKTIGLSLFLAFLIIYFINSGFNYRVYPNDLGAFKYRFITQEKVKSAHKVLNYYEKYNHKVIFVGPNAYYYKLIGNYPLNNLDLINTGNWGYNGSSKLLESVKKLDSDYAFFLNKNEIGRGKQTDQELIHYIIDNGKIIDSFGNYNIYVLGE